MRRKAKTKYRHRIRLERASPEQLNGNNKTTDVSSTGNVKDECVRVD